MKLIDADSFKAHVAAAVLNGNQEHKDRASALFRAIDSMPVAYDVDKVVEQLKESAIEYEIFGQCSDYVELNHAIENVRAGGGNEDN